MPQLLCFQLPGTAGTPMSQHAGIDSGQVLKLLWPENTAATAVVIFLASLFGLWLLSLAFCWIRLLWQLRQLKNAAETRSLAEVRFALTRRMVGEEAGQPEVAETEAIALDEIIREAANSAQDNSRKPPPTAEEALDRFSDIAQVKKSSVAFGHIKTIYQAGLSDGRLDIGELLKATMSRLFRANSWLRPVLGTFIVLGLLGTLFGLADSLAQLAPLGEGSHSLSNEQISGGIANLLSQLKSAFAPSIWGVSLTAAGVMVYTLYLRFACAPVQDELTRLTLDVWVPELYPATTQKLTDTLKLTEEQMVKSFAAASKVAEFSKGIEQGTGHLNTTLRDAVSSLSSLQNSADNIASFADNFKSAVGSLTHFQNDLQILYQQMLANSATLNQAITNSTQGLVEFQKSAFDMLNLQHSQLDSILAGLKSYESAYIASRGRIDNRIEEVLGAARGAFGDLSERNLQLVHEIGDPLRKELVTSLSHIEDTLQIKMNTLSDRISSFDVPMNRAAEKVSRALETVERRTAELLTELQQELFKQDEKNRTQLNHIAQVNSNIALLLAEIPEAKRAQEQQAGILARDVSALSAGLGRFAEALAELTGSISRSDHSQQQMLEQYKKNHEELACMNEINTSIREFLAEIPRVQRSQEVQAAALGAEFASLTGGFKEFGQTVSTLNRALMLSDQVLHVMSRVSSNTAGISSRMDSLLQSNERHSEQIRSLKESLGKTAADKKSVRPRVSSAAASESPPAWTAVVPPTHSTEPKFSDAQLKDLPNSPQRSPSDEASSTSLVGNRKRGQESVHSETEPALDVLPDNGATNIKGASPRRQAPAPIVGSEASNRSVDMIDPDYLCSAPPVFADPETQRPVVLKTGKSSRWAALRELPGKMADLPIVRGLRRDRHEG